MSGREPCLTGMANMICLFLFRIWEDTVSMRTVREALWQLHCGLSEPQVPSPEVLGVPESVIDLYQRKKGLILVTGPTGSGKSTTLAAIIDKIITTGNAM